MDKSHIPTLVIAPLEKKKSCALVLFDMNLITGPVLKFLQWVQWHSSKNHAIEFEARIV